MFIKFFVTDLGSFVNSCLSQIIIVLKIEKLCHLQFVSKE